ncbi:MAG: PAS domain-containing sensor histidine kinase [Gemmatimonadota bacterium]
MPLLWERIFEAIDEGLIALDRQGTFLYANVAGAAVFGEPPDRLAGRRITDFTHSHETATLAGIIAHTLEDARPAQVEVYSPPQQKWHAVRSYPAPGGVTVLLQDITDKKIAEDALRVSEAKFAGIVNISADAIISIDADQRIIHFNSGAEEIFGWSASEMIGDTLDVLIPERFRASHPQQIRNFAASPVDARRMGERREISGLRRNGEEFPAEASISKLTVGDQRIFTVVLRDVSERKQREETYRRLYEEAQRAVAARDDVLSFVSHDLGNPLAAIRIATAVLLKRIDPEDPDFKQVAGIREAIEQAQGLIRDLLDIQKAEAGKLALHFEKLDIDQLIDESIQALRPMIDEKSVRIAREIAREVPRVEADRDRILQVLSNLLGNAVKFSPAGGSVVVNTAQNEWEVVVSIHDRGPGISADDLPHIFDRYFQARKAGKVGHGLGLSIVQAITKAHGGRVWAESALGEGSTFYFSLPLTTHV